MQNIFYDLTLKFIYVYETKLTTTLNMELWEIENKIKDEFKRFDFFLLTNSS